MILRAPRATADEGAAGVAPLPVGSHRRGEWLFRSAAVAAGSVIVISIVAIALFLLIRAVPSLRANDANFFTTPTFATDDAAHLAFGIRDLLMVTVLSSVFALLLAVPVAIGIAVFLTQYAPAGLSRPFGVVVDLLAAVPSIIFGLWGIFVLAPILEPATHFLNAHLGWLFLFKTGNVSLAGGGTIFTGGVVLAVMILPIITSLCREVFLQTPKLHEEAALALGATRWEMVRMAVFPFARAGIVSAIMLGLGRALGETMAVAMVLSGANVIKLEMLTQQNPISIAARIALDFPESSGIAVNQLIAAGLVLFVITLAVNMVARWIVARRAAFSGAN